MKVILKIIGFIISFYVLICCCLYFFQENIIFIPEKLNQNHQFRFKEKFEELSISTADGTKLNGLIFKSENPKGVIFYLHGNAGSLNTWGEVANSYVSLNYDVFMIDYRGYGKSEGSIINERQLYEDNQLAYNEIKKRYIENKIIVLGYSIGTGLASKLASTNSPRLLILQAPYYSLTDMMQNTYPYVPTFLLKYKLDTHKNLKICPMPVVIFHGNDDRVIYYGSSLKLKKLFKPEDKLITLENQGHNRFTDNQEYIKAITEVLN